MTHHFATSAAVPAPSSFTKQQLLEELSWFVPAFEQSVERMLSPVQGTGLQRPVGAIPVSPQASPLWRALDELFDYGVHGALPAGGELDEGTLLDVDLFLQGIDGLEELLALDDGGIPRLAKATLALAKARQALDLMGGDQLMSVDQVAVLARAPLEVVIHRLDVTVDAELPVGRVREALSRVFGYLPTGEQAAPSHQFIPGLAVELPIDVVRAINDRAGLAGVTPYEVLRAAFAHEIRRDAYVHPRLCLTGYVEAGRCEPAC